MSPARVTSERRAFSRHRARVVVTWRDRAQRAMDGEICDVSERGVFLVSRTALPDEVGVGDRTLISVRTEHGQAELAGTVRWRGYHPAHEAIGCGVLLDEASQAAVLDLFPELFRGS